MDVKLVCNAHWAVFNYSIYIIAGLEAEQSTPVSRALRGRSEFNGFTLINATRLQQVLRDSSVPKTSRMSLWGPQHIFVTFTSLIRNGYVTGKRLSLEFEPGTLALLNRQSYPVRVVAQSWTKNAVKSRAPESLKQSQIKYESVSRALSFPKVNSVQECNYRLGRLQYNARVTKARQPAPLYASCARNLRDCYAALDLL